MKDGRTEGGRMRDRGKTRNGRAAIYPITVRDGKTTPGRIRNCRQLGGGRRTKSSGSGRTTGNGTRNGRRAPSNQQLLRKPGPKRGPKRKKIMSIWGKQTSVNLSWRMSQQIRLLRGGRVRRSPLFLLEASHGQSLQRKFLLSVITRVD